MQRGIGLLLMWAVTTWVPAAFAQDEGEEANPAGNAAEEVKADDKAKSKEKVPPEPPVKSDKPVAAQPSDKVPDEKYGLAGPVKIGATAVVGVMHPLNYTLDIMYQRVVGFEFSTGMYEFEQEETVVQLANWDVKLRWHPFLGSFFLGAAYGEQDLLGRIKTDIEMENQGLKMTIPTTAQVVVNTKYLTPQLGWFAIFDFGLVLGFELGVQVPLSSSTEFDVAFEGVPKSLEQEVKDSESYKKADQDVKDVGKQFGEATLPYVALLRLGFML